MYALAGPTQTAEQYREQPWANTDFRRAIIRPTAIEHNVKHLKKMAGTEEFIAVVKADGYGHGAVQAAQAAIRGGATRIGVADLNEALKLRHAGIVQVPILAWLHPLELSFQVAAAAEIELGVWSSDQLRQAAAAAVPGRPAVLHIKIETGLARGGAAPTDWTELFALAQKLEARGLIKVQGLFSHLSSTSAEQDLQQLRFFEDAIQQAKVVGVNPPLRHLAATAATISLPKTRLNAVRVGLGIYGLSPFAERSSNDLGLLPAMTLQAPIVVTRRVGPGHGVSYGYDHKTRKETTLALVPLGYADGIPRQASGQGIVSINGKEYPAVGRVAMDQFVVDVSDDPVQTGDLATVFGDPTDKVPSADCWANTADTINYEIVTRIGPRVRRVYMED